MHLTILETESSRSEGPIIPASGDDPLGGMTWCIVSGGNVCDREKLQEASDGEDSVLYFLQLNS